MKFSIIVVLIVLVCGVFCDEGRDSYIDAYHESRKELNGNKNDRKYEPYYDNNGPDGSYDIHPGYPEQHFPPSNYGPPVYGPPNHIPSFSPMLPFYGMPHAMLGLLDKIKLKLNIYTILKLILKLVIFKKIVSFIALICLLLIIPKFKIGKSDDDTDGKSISNNNLSSNEYINNLTDYVITAIESYAGIKNSTNCTGSNCNITKMFKEIDKKLSYQKLLTTNNTK